MKYIFMMYLCLSVVLCFDRSLSAADAAGDTPNVTIEAHNAPLEKVLQEVAKQTKWNFNLDPDLAQQPVSGTFNQQHIDHVIKALLHKENHLVEVDVATRTYNIRAFGSKMPFSVQVTEQGSSLLAEEQPQIDIAALHAEEQRIFEAYINNPDSIEPLTGMTLGEIAAIQAEEQRVYEEYLNNPDSIEPLTGMTLGEIAAIQAEEQRMYDANLNNPNAIEPLTGMPFSEIESIQAKEKVAFEQYINNPSSVEPLTGMTFMEIEQVQKREEQLSAQQNEEMYFDSLQ
ncbi:hypothetical protein [Desulfobulbus alkaliphilus]|uniref:hypothetical protein n=1 Tax=Desulfobulbus alkaliphilus TaxID=869814 RepID=UPI001966BBED|nr:hypothetical protein [Desulfobulbus alkaliphilus]MBM9538615.1 hypothetical protein [Desulfobulbus alkaliphilus]